MEGAPAPNLRTPRGLSSSDFPFRHGRLMSEIRIGTSGWAYRSWRGRFFPKEVMVRDHLRYYATRFDTTELNGVFYRTPTLDAVKNWVAQTPDDFAQTINLHPARFARHPPPHAAEG